MKNVLVRQSSEQDTNAIYNLVPHLSPLTLHTRYTYWNLFRNFNDSCFVATDQEQPVGFITSHPTTTPSSEWFIWQAGILPEYRRTGLIDELQDHVIDVARNSGALALNISIETDNPRSFGAFNRMAIRLGTSMEEVERFSLTPENPSVVPEVLYRIAL
jgi:diaminobutyrate acetyltransferase